MARNDQSSHLACELIWPKSGPAEETSPLAERPYDLRHARLSTWLNAGVAPAQVGEWADSSIPVLLRVFRSVDLSAKSHGYVIRKSRGIE